MAEDLGNITIRFGDGPGGGGAGGTQDLAMAREAAKSAMAGIMSNIPAFARVVQAGMRGEGFGGVARATSTAVTASGSGIGAMALGAAAFGAGALLASVVSVRAIVSRILDRVSDLASVNAVMAREEAMNRMAQMRRDMREAEILAPLYQRVSEIWRSLQDQFQPFLLAIKAAVLGVLVPILRVFGSLLSFISKVLVDSLKGVQSLVYMISELFREAGVAFNILAQAFPSFQGLFAPIANAFFGLQAFGRGVGRQIGTIVNILQQQQASGANPNAILVDTLEALSNPSLATFRARVRQGPVRGPSRSQAPTP